MKSVEYDLRYLQAGLEALEDYLLSAEVFWPLGVNPPEGEPDYPRLTLDGLLLARSRLIPQAEGSGEQSAVEQAVSALDNSRSRWRVAWEKKAVQCLHMRVRLWRDYIEEYRKDPQENADRFAYEVRLRVMIQLLMKEVGTQAGADAELVSAMDKVLQSDFVSGSFIWEPQVSVGFPKETYWYLYGKPAGIG